jgi:hypothetical protein
MLTAMCCFSRPVRFVGATRIFARAAGPGDARQWLVYAMSVELDEELAMVLPLPVPPSPGDDAVSFVDLSGYASLFTDLESAFPPDWSTVSQAKGGLARSAPAVRPPLAVVDVGSFEASFVPRRADFSRLDPRFRLSDAVWASLEDYGDWGFAVFQLKPRRAGFFRRVARQTVHPMAFSFPRRDPEALFFPTLHVHDGDVPARARFDHTLFCQVDGVLDATLGWDTSLGPLGASVAPERARGVLDPGRAGRRTSLHNELPNRDVVLRPPAGVQLEDLAGKGETYSYRVCAGSAYLPEPWDAQREAWQRTARERLPGLCRGLREGLRALTAERREAWALAPLTPSLPRHFVNGSKLWTGDDYRTGAPASPGGPGRLAMRVFTDSVEPQDVTLGFARLPDQAALDRIRAALAALVERSAGP